MSQPDEATDRPKGGRRVNNIGGMWEEMHKMKKDVEAIQPLLDEFAALKESVALLQRLLPNQGMTPSTERLAVQRAWSFGGWKEAARQEAEAEVDAPYSAAETRESIVEDIATQAKQEVTDCVTDIQAALEEINSVKQEVTDCRTDIQSALEETNSVWEKVRRQGQDISTLQHTSATTTAVTAVQEEVWSVWDAVKRQRQDINSLQQMSTAAAHQDHSKRLLALKEETKKLASELECEVKERLRFQAKTSAFEAKTSADLEGHAQQFGEAIRDSTEEALSATKAELAKWRSECIQSAASVASMTASPRTPVSPSHLPLQRPKGAPRVPNIPLTPECPMYCTPRAASSPLSGRSCRWLDLQDSQWPQASASRCEQLDFQEPDGLVSETVSPICQQLYKQLDQLEGTKDATERTFLQRFGSTSTFNCDWLDIKEHARSEARILEEDGPQIRRVVTDLTSRLADLSSVSTELRVRQDLLELRVEDKCSRQQQKHVLRGELGEMGLLPGGLCRGETVFADSSEHTNAAFWRGLQRDYSRMPLRVLGVGEERGKVELVCAAYGTHLVVDFRRLTKSPPTPPQHSKEKKKIAEPGK